LEKQLNRKDKALAETAALWLLREKYNTIWDNSADVLCRTLGKYLQIFTETLFTTALYGDL